MGGLAGAGRPGRAPALTDGRRRRAAAGPAQKLACPRVSRRLPRAIARAAQLCLPRTGGTEAGPAPGPRRRCSMEMLFGQALWRVRQPAAGSLAERASGPQAARSGSAGDAGERAASDGPPSLEVVRFRGRAGRAAPVLSQCSPRRIEVTCRAKQRRANDGRPQLPAILVLATCTFEAAMFSMHQMFSASCSGVGAPAP